MTIDDALGYVPGNILTISHAAEEVWEQISVEDRKLIAAKQMIASLMEAGEEPCPECGKTYYPHLCKCGDLVANG